MGLYCPVTLIFYTQLIANRAAKLQAAYMARNFASGLLYNLLPLPHLVPISQKHMLTYLSNQTVNSLNLSTYDFLFALMPRNVPVQTWLLEIDYASCKALASFWKETDLYYWPATDKQPVNPPFW